MTRDPRRSREDLRGVSTVSLNSSSTIELEIIHLSSNVSEWTSANSHSRNASGVLLYRGKVNSPRRGDRSNQSPKSSATCLSIMQTIDMFGHRGILWPGGGGGGVREQFYEYRKRGDPRQRGMESREPARWKPMSRCRRSFPLSAGTQIEFVVRAK